MHYGQFFQSHVLHFFHLASPDLLFGIDAAPEMRNIIGVAKENKHLAVMGVMMRKFGQEIIKVTAGKKIHGTGAIPGGINKHLTEEERDYFLKGDQNQNVDQMIDWSLEALDFLKDYHKKNKDFIDNFASFPSNHLSLVRKDGALDLYHGVLRAVDKDGNKILNDVDYQEYLNYIGESVKSWSFMKFPYLKHLGLEKGWYRVGPLARLNTCDYIPSRLADKEFEEFKAYTNGKPNNMTMHYHWARLIETLHAAEVMKDLLNDPDLLSGERVVKGTRQDEGIGLIEAPRGTLFHHYRVNADDQITMANLIVSTTNNNDPMNLAVDSAAKQMMTDQPVITEAMTNAVEVAIRAYDPCLSCATHALGQMPLQITMKNEKNEILDIKTT
ncbi:MAG: Ni/Fe hydrogenase subunit alpha [Saprospiraceae bacterium]